VRRLARRLHEETRALPIVSPHGHVAPALLADDAPFPEPAALLLTPDHYVFRMLYSQGVPMEALGVPPRGPAGAAGDGDAGGGGGGGAAVERDPRAAWRRFAAHYHLFRGTPTRAWLDYVLHELFGVRVKLAAATAERVYDQVAERLAGPDFRPRALFERFGLEVLATTDAAGDDLAHHRALRASGWAYGAGRVVPTFRPDALFRIAQPGWADALAGLERARGAPARDLAAFVAALAERRAYFRALGAPAATTCATARSVALVKGAKVKIASGARADEVYEYLGADRTGVDLTGEDFNDTSLWSRLGLTRTADEVRAGITGASIHASGALVVDAAAEQTILATVVAAAVGVSGGGTTGFALSGAGVYTENRIATDVRAVVDGDGDFGITASAVTVEATDASGIRAIAGAAAIAASFGGTSGLAFSLALSVAINDVSNRVEAAIQNADQGVTTTSGPVTVTARTLGRALFDFTGSVTAAQLDDLTFEDRDDPDTTSTDETTVDLANDGAIRSALAARFAAGGHALGSGWTIVALRPGSVWQVTSGIQTYVITLTGASFFVAAPTIQAVSVGASIAAGFGGTTGIAVSGAGAVALNSITTRTNAHIDASAIVSQTSVTIEATATPRSVPSSPRSRWRSAEAARSARASPSVSPSRRTSSARASRAAPAPRSPRLHPGLVDRRQGRRAADHRDRPARDRRGRRRRVGRRRRRRIGGVAASGAGVYTETASPRTSSFVDGTRTGGITATTVTLSALDRSSIGAIAGGRRPVLRLRRRGGGLRVRRRRDRLQHHRQRGRGVHRQRRPPRREPDRRPDAQRHRGRLDRRADRGGRARDLRRHDRRGDRGGGRLGQQHDPHQDRRGHRERRRRRLRRRGDRHRPGHVEAARACGHRVRRRRGGRGRRRGLDRRRDRREHRGHDRALRQAHQRAHATQVAVGTRVRVASGRDLGDVWQRTDAPGASDPLGLGYGGWTLVGRSSVTQAFIKSSSVDAAGALTLQATSGQTIQALVLSGSVAASAGAVGISLSGAGVSATNTIAAITAATIDGDGATGVRAASISITALDTSTIEAVAGAASVAAAFGVGASFALTIGVALAENTIANEVHAHIANGDTMIKARTGGIVISATETATIKAISAAASIAVAIDGIGAASIAGAGGRRDQHHPHPDARRHPRLARAEQRPRGRRRHVRRDGRGEDPRGLGLVGRRRRCRHRPGHRRRPRAEPHRLHAVGHPAPVDDERDHHRLEHRRRGARSRSTRSAARRSTRSSSRAPSP
jgi:hypothetical protein